MLIEWTPVLTQVVNNEIVVRSNDPFSVDGSIGLMRPGLKAYAYDHSNLGAEAWRHDARENHGTAGWVPTGVRQSRVSRVQNFFAKTVDRIRPLCKSGLAHGKQQQHRGP